jgi:hypothetical protein
MLTCGTIAVRGLFNGWLCHRKRNERYESWADGYSWRAGGGGIGEGGQGGRRQRGRDGGKEKGTEGMDFCFKTFVTRCRDEVDKGAPSANFSAFRRYCLPASAYGAHAWCIFAFPVRLTCWFLFGICRTRPPWNSMPRYIHRNLFYNKGSVVTRDLGI